MQTVPVQIQTLWTSAQLLTPSSHHSSSQGRTGAKKVALDFLAQSGPPNPVRNTPHHTINEWHILDVIICLFWCIWQIVNHFKEFFFFFVINNFLFFFTHNTISKIKQNKTADTYSTSQGSIKREGEREGQLEHKSYSFK